MQMRGLSIVVEALFGLLFSSNLVTVNGLSETELADVLTSTSTFPEGTYQISTHDVVEGPMGNAPLPLDSSLLGQFRGGIHESSVVAEANRLCDFYVRLPSFLNNVEDGRAVGIRFGNSETIHAVPLTKLDSHNLGDGSVIYQIPIQISGAICSDLDPGSCSVVLWTAYFFLSRELACKAPFYKDLPVACGSQCRKGNMLSPCASSCSQCGMQEDFWSRTLVTKRLQMGTTAAKDLLFTYSAAGSGQQITIWHQGKVIFDSGCGKKRESLATNISFEGNSVEPRIDLEPHCRKDWRLAEQVPWRFSLQCPECSGCQEYQCLDESRAHCGVNGSLISHGMHFCNRYKQFYDQFDPRGGSFIDCIQEHHLDFVEDYLAGSSGKTDCADLHTKAFDGYLQGYKRCHFCFIFSTNAPQFIKVIYESPNGALLWDRIGDLVDNCGAEYKKNLCQQYSNLTSICD